MRALEHKIPPPIVVLLTSVAMKAVASTTSPLPLAPALRWGAAGACVLFGLALAALGFLEFRRAKTTINPLEPEAASSLVTRGIYAYTRNPMYIGFAAVLVGWAIYLAAPWSMLGPLAFVLFITKFQIRPEERALGSTFGAAYSDYVRKTRRWL